MSITVIHGPMATGKTFHKQAFAKYYGCATIVDDWEAWEHEIPDDGRLILTTSPIDRIGAQFRCDAPDQPVRFVDITTARSAIGVAPHAPEILNRFSR